MPIDIATGNVQLEYEEALIPGKVDLLWERRYSGMFLGRQVSPLGRGWISRYRATLSRSVDGFEFETPTGSVEFLPDREGAVERGEVIHHYGAFLEIFMERDRYVVQNWDVESGDVWRYCFVPGARGQPWPLSSIEDLTGQGLDLIKDSYERLTAIHQRLENRALRLDYYPDGLLHSVTLQAPNGESYPLARYEYDTQGRLSAAFNALDHADRYEYDVDGRLVRYLAKDGGVFSYRYDSKGRCIWYSGLDHYDEKRLRFLDAVRITEVTDSYGTTSRYKYLPSGQITSEWNALGAETRTEYDVHGRVISKTMPTGATTLFAYDERGNRSQIVNAVGNIFELTFNNRHQPTALKDPNNQMWLRQYDERHCLIGTDDPLGGHWAIKYDADGNVVSLVNPKGATRHFRYRSGVLSESTDWLGNWTRVEYDLRGSLTARIDPLGHVLRYRYDPLGNPIQVMLPDDTKIHAQYDAGGNLTRLTDAAGRVTSRRYGPCQRLLETTDPNGYSVAYIWGTEPFRLERVINERTEIYQFIYNVAGQCTDEIGFDGRHLQFAYDLAGACIRTVNGAGETIDIERDPLGRIVGQKLLDGRSARFVYDQLGNLIEAINTDSTVRLERDAVGRLLREVQQSEQGTHWVCYTLDALGEPIRLETDLGLRVDYELDANGLWSNLRIGDSHTIQFRRDARGQEIQRWLPGGLLLDWKHDPVGRLIEQRLGRFGARLPNSDPANWTGSIGHVLIRRVYTRDSSGLVGSTNDQLLGTTQYVYDPGERLLRALRDHGPSEQFDYDAAGNLTRIVNEGHGGDRDENLTFGPGNRLLSRGRTRYEHDGQGRMVKKIEEADSAQAKTWKYEWDALDQLRAVTRPDGQVWRYDYDAFSRRVVKSGRDQKVRFIWSGSVPIHELFPLDRHWTAHLFSQHGFVPLAQVKDRKLYPVVVDQLGTPQEMVDVYGQLVWQRYGMAYGKTESERSSKTSPIFCPFRFQGQYEDAESGLCYNRFRYCDTDNGRYISQDPISLVGGINLYAYTSNPINSIDPVGLAPPCKEEMDRAKKAAEKTIEDAKDGKVRLRPDYHGRLPAEQVADILASPGAVFLSEGSSRRLIFSKNGNVVVTEGPGSSRGQAITSYGPGGPQGTSGAAIFGGAPTDPGKPVTPAMITGGTVPDPSGGTLPPGHQVWP